LKKRMKVLMSLKNQKRNIRKDKMKRILDMGCGMKPIKEATHILDYNPNLKKFAVPGVKFIHHDLNKTPYPFPDCYFDYIHIWGVIEHLTISEEKLFKELWRITNLNGFIKVMVPNSLFIYHRIIYLLGWVPCDFVLPHRKHYNFRQFATFIRNAGFKIFELQNLWIFNPFRNFTNKHIVVLFEKIDYTYEGGGN